MQDMINRAEVYNLERIEKFIKLSRTLINKYREIAESENITLAYKEYLYITTNRSCPICQYASFINRSCSACSIYVVSGKRCNEHRSYNDLDDVLEHYVKRRSKVAILNNRISFHLYILNKLLSLRSFLYPPKES